MHCVIPDTSMHEHISPFVLQRLEHSKALKIMQQNNVHNVKVEKSCLLRLY